MMDRGTFDKYYEDDLETKSKIASLPNLTESEHHMHQLLFKNKWRLEQEKIPMDYILLQLKTLTEKPLQKLQEYQVFFQYFKKFIEENS